MMKRIIYIFTAAALILGLSGCTHPFLSRRSEGFARFSTAVRYLKNDPSLYKEIRVPAFSVFVVGDRAVFDWMPAKVYGSSIAGYAKRDEIWILGYTARGKIIMSEAILGHELMHLLNWRDPDIADPDHLENLFE